MFDRNGKVIAKMEGKGELLNAPFLSCFKPLYQSEASCTIRMIENELICMWTKSHLDWMDGREDLLWERGLR